MATIELDKLVKRYGKMVAVHGIDLEVKDGEFIVLVGPSGCGKSTTLRMIAGLEDITAGTLRIGGQVVNEREPKHRNIAMVFQNYAIYPHMSVAKNIGFGLYTSRLDQAEKDRRVAETAAILGLEAYLDRRPSELSGGQRQRVAIGRAMVRDPQAFLFDEPLSNLDAQLRAQMRLEIKRLHQRLGTTIVFVTHDQVEAMTLADRIVVMRDGRILQVGRPLDVYENPNDVFTARFIGSPTMNLLPGQLVGHGGQPHVHLDGIAGDDIALQRLAGTASPGAGVLLSVRPHDLVVGAPQSGGFKVRGRVAVVEPLGSETLIHLESEGQQIVATGSGRTLPAIGEDVEASVPAEHLYIFDATTEKSLRQQ
ncbi:ABC transporter ATP-binding protein [Consotaella aegiceratis]|uniref:ABC transporter ATP-binding protein n=1 Tax=Consotaella aegiceratis TaxID=3097961 RepID=UPI002F3E3147